ncbi:Pentatricopeptide repeat-containing protein [Hibiscus syriacus]|uniref:Pentatricopeptide repeat-containing protein n=1 Tax=Hibiscus syriacus TaxID=106335 RepID=A0A6A3CPF5_HIBSY|nr:Pentatricopeptide repeat-containing protein [Hibiscus syriacus]
MDKANLLIQHCSESSKLYLAITAKAILLRCVKIRKTLEIFMNQVQEMVPPSLAEKIAGIIDELRSASSIASLVVSFLGLRLEIGSVSHYSVSTNSSLDSSDRKCKDETTSSPPKVAAESHSRSHQHHSSKTSSNGLLEDNDKGQHLTFSNSHVIPVIKFLKGANEICDITMQKDGAEVLLAILSGSRIELPPFHEDVIHLLVSLMDSETAGESLAIMEILSRQSYYKSIIVACGILPSILKLLDTTVKEFNLLALRILGNLSNGSDAGYHITYLGYVPKLVSFLQDPNVAGYCIEIVNNIRNIEEARVEAVEAGLCTSIATIWNPVARKSKSLPSNCSCFYVTRTQGSEDASILLDLIDFVIKNDASQCSVIVSSLSGGNSNVSSSSSNSSGLKRSSYKALRDRVYGPTR